MQPTWALTVVPSLRSECAVSERKCSIQIPFPDLDLITKVTFFLWILPMSQCSLRSYNLSDLDRSSGHLVLHSTFLFRLTPRPLHLQPLTGPRFSSFSNFLSHHNPAPAKRPLEWDVYCSPHYKKIPYHN